MAKEEIEATALTLRFKHYKTTILLFVEPLTPFSSVLNDLLSTLRERYHDGIPSSPIEPSSDPITHPLPEDILDIVLGVPMDVYDPSKGWTEINTSGGGIKESPRSLGLKDGSVLAFAFTNAEGTGEFKVEWSSYDEAYGEQPGSDGDEEMDADDDDEKTLVED